MASNIPAQILAEEGQVIEGMLLSPEALQATLELGYMVIIFPILGSGLAITLATWRGLARRLSRTSPMRRELRALELLGDAGLAVPKVVGASDLTPLRTRWTEALLLEDLGECTRAMVHTRQLAGMPPDPQETRDCQSRQAKRRR